MTDCSALTWLFRSRDLSPKLHRWALRLMEYDMELRWRAGTSHQLADALSRLHTVTAGATDVDGSFPDEVASSSGIHRGPQGPLLDGIPLSELEVQPVAGPRPIPLAAFVHKVDHSDGIDPVPLHLSSL